jgi:alpha-N-arabinofuranosidase
MDGPWQIGHKTAQEYGRAALETAKVMRWTDPTIQLAACGSSNRNMRSYGAWEYEVLDHCFDEVDFISLHTYFRNDADELSEYFCVIELMDAFIKEVVAICDSVAAKRRSLKRIMLSFDEWNVWYRTHKIEDMRKPGWPKAPPLIEEIYNVEDALIVGGALIALMNNADRVKAASLAQLVNVIGPIMTETGGAAWRQTIFHPFAQASRHGHGRVMQTRIDSPGYAAKAYPEMPYLYATVVDNPADGTTTLFALNRHLNEPLDVKLELRGLGADRKLVEATEIHHANLKAINSRETPNAVVPRANADVSVTKELVTARLKPASWNVIVTRAG